MPRTGSTRSTVPNPQTRSAGLRLETEERVERSQEAESEPSDESMPEVPAFAPMEFAPVDDQLGSETEERFELSQEAETVAEDRNRVPEVARAIEFLADRLADISYGASHLDCIDESVRRAGERFSELSLFGRRRAHDEVVAEVG